MPTAPGQVPVSPSPDAARRRLQIHGIKEMPAGYDAEVADLFRDLRAASNLSETELAAKLSTRIEVVQALEQGALYALPPWPETCRIVNGYGALLNLDVRPLLRRIYAQLDAGIVELGPKPVPPDVPVLDTPGAADFGFGTDRAAPSVPTSPQRPNGPQAFPQGSWPAAAPSAPAQNVRHAPTPTAAPQANWPGAQQASPRAPQAPQAPPRQQQPQQQPRQAQASPTAQPQGNQFSPQVQPPRQQTQQAQQPRQAPPAAPDLAAPAPDLAAPAPEPKKAPGRPALLKWGLGALIVSAIAFGLWFVLADQKGPLGSFSSSPSAPSEPVLEPDDPRSRKADRLPNAF